MLISSSRNEPTNSANPPAITNLGDPIADNPADNANGTVRPSLNP